MKRIAVVLFTIMFLVSCAGFELKDDAMGNSTGYFAGKGLGIAFYEGAPNSRAQLESNFDAFMARNAGVELVPPAETMELFNSSILILTLEVADPYGLISDLTFLLSQFGGELLVVPGADPILEGVQPIPMAVFNSFAMGWDSGVRIAQQL